MSKNITSNYEIINIILILHANSKRIAKRRIEKRKKIEKSFFFLEFLLLY